MPELREYTATKRQSVREYEATLRRRILESFFGVSIQSTNSPITEGDTLNVDTLVEETGGLSDTQDVALDVPPGTQVDVQSVSLNADGSATITLSWSTQSGDAGDYTAEVASEDDTATVTITVDAAALIWDATDLDNGTDSVVVHEDTANTAYGNASEIRKGDPTGAPLYASDLEAWYPLQEPSGSDLVDFGPNAYATGTYNGVTLGGGTPVTGIPTHSWDGNDDYADTGQKFQYLHEGNFTISFWIWIPSDTSSTGYLFDTGGGSASNGGGYAVEIYNSTRGTGEDATFLPRYSGNTPAISVNLSEKGEWIHVAHTMDADGNVNGEARGYKNGSLVDSDASTPSEPNNTSVPNTLQLGRIDGSFGINFYGYLFDFRLYNRALSANEVQELYDVFARASSHETVYKGPSPSSSPTASFTSVSIPSGASATLEFLEDTNGDGTVDNTTSPITMTNNTTDYTASGLSGSGELALRVTLSNTDLTVGSTVKVPVEVTA